MKHSSNQFKIKEIYLVSVPDIKPVYFKSEGRTIEGFAYGIVDHPKFAALRNKLEKLGYIKTWREIWNGDRVLKPFVLNGVKFKKGDQFSCGAALGNMLKSKKI